MRVASVVATLVLLAGCSGSGGGGALGSKVDASSPPVVAMPTAEASIQAPTAGTATGSAVDIASLSGQIVFDNHVDVWTINADGTGAIRLTGASSPIDASATAALRRSGS